MSCQQTRKLLNLTSQRAKDTLRLLSGQLTPYMIHDHNLTTYFSHPEPFSCRIIPSSSEAVTLINANNPKEDDA